MSDFLCVNCGNYLLEDPVQLPCGDRLCGPCHSSYKTKDVLKLDCPLCRSEVLLEDCFRDRALTMELKKTFIKCLNPGCPWEGKSEDYKEHSEMCKFAIVSCPYEKYGCQEMLSRSEMNVHESKCTFIPVKCKYCKEDILVDEITHVKSCPSVTEFCTNGCGEKVARKDMDRHKRTVCTHQLRECEFKEEGCTFMGCTKDLSKHYRENYTTHMQLMRQNFRRIELSLDGQIKTLMQQNADLKSELNHTQLSLPTHLQPLKDSIAKADTAIQHLQESFSDMALMVQTLQATSYNGVFIWKIPEVHRCRHEAKIGKTISLYSAPFYTSRHGYKVCLRLYMDGDGSGRGTHLSFFLTIMRGEYDALLQWPFRQTVTLTLLDQDKSKDIVQSFRPEPASSSFQRPRNEMNVASGCPLFAPLSVLNNSSYVKEDTMFLKCQIDRLGIEPDIVINFFIN